VAEQLDTGPEQRGLRPDRCDAVVHLPGRQHTGLSPADDIGQLLGLMEPKSHAPARDHAGAQLSTGAGGDEHRGRQDDDLGVRDPVGASHGVQLVLHLGDVDSRVDERLPRYRHRHEDLGVRPDGSHGSQVRRFSASECSGHTEEQDAGGGEDGQGDDH
jgi:hypothetical protein